MTAEGYDYDAVVIGSGFGGAVTGCRLAQAGYGVVILERGHRWGPRRGYRNEGSRAGDQPDADVMAYPRTSRDPWLWDHEHPERTRGWVDFRQFPHMRVIQGAGVGGGSLIYANVSIDANPESFARGWPEQITFEKLAPYYARVGEMLELGRVPERQRSERVSLMRDAAHANGWGERFHAVDVAVRFDPEMTYDSSQRPDPAKFLRERNRHGAWQGSCAHLANCDIGCDVGAKNTLDKNYLFVAERERAQIRPLHLVRSIEVFGAGYRVHFDRIVEDRFEPGSVTGRLVIVAAGSLGSTELLLRCRDQYRTLPRLSRVLGQGWSSNGDFLTPALHFGRPLLYPGRGITIAGSINFLDGRPDDPAPPQEKPKFLIEDGGFPYQVAGALIRHLAMNRGHDVRLRHRVLHLGLKIAARLYDFVHWVTRRSALRFLRPLFEHADPINHLMPWFAQGQDKADGTLSIRHGELHLDWPYEHSKPVIDAIYETHRRLARSTGGWVLPPITWTWFHSLITPHPLGGCNMGTDAETGVVDHTGEVFEYRGLYVADGAIVPEALGLNPSKTIAALAERIAEHIIRDHPPGPR